MSASLVVLVAALFGVGTYLLLHRTLTRIVLGVGMLGNGVNVLIVATGSRAGEAPMVGNASATDSVPQALVLTAIVIGFAITAFLLALVWRNWTIDGNDVVEDDVEDRLVARAAERIAGDVPDREDVEA